MPFADSDGARIYFDDRGAGEPAILCLPGWCVHHSIFAPTAERLSARHRVRGMDWRGHGRSPVSDREWGHAEMLADALAVIRASGIEAVIPLTQAHAGWIALLLRQQLGQRVPKMVFASWNPIVTADNPLAPPFLAAQEPFTREHAWLAVQRVEGVSHFPTLEVPDESAAVIEAFIGLATLASEMGPR